MSSISTIPGSNFNSRSGILLSDSMDGFQMIISGMFGLGVVLRILIARSVMSVPMKPRTTADQENPANTKTDDH